MDNEFVAVTDEDGLVHYGVLGMKWGVHQARKKGTTYQYKSMGTKHYAKKAERYRTAGKSDLARKYDKRTKRSEELDRKLQKAAEKMTVGEGIVRNILYGHGSAAKTTQLLDAINPPKSAKSKMASDGAVAVSGWLIPQVGHMAMNEIIRYRYVTEDEN